MAAEERSDVIVADVAAEVIESHDYEEATPPPIEKELTDEVEENILETTPEGANESSDNDDNDEEEEDVLAYEPTEAPIPLPMPTFSDFDIPLPEVEEPPEEEPTPEPLPLAPLPNIIHAYDFLKLSSTPDPSPSLQGIQIVHLAREAGLTRDLQATLHRLPPGTRMTRMF